MSQSPADISDTATDLTDSLLHTNITRVLLGIICGLAAGVVMLIFTSFFPPAGSTKLWWINLTASAIFGGEALAYDMATPVMIAGLSVHFAVAALCGFIMGKLTLTKDIKTLVVYGIVLSMLCWLASNMFGPNFLNFEALKEVGQWFRGAIFGVFGLALSLFFGLSVKMLKD